MWPYGQSWSNGHGDISPSLMVLLLLLSLRRNFSLMPSPGLGVGRPPMMTHGCATALCCCYCLCARCLCCRCLHCCCCLEETSLWCRRLVWVWVVPQWWRMAAPLLRQWRANTLDGHPNGKPDRAPAKHIHLLTASATLVIISIQCWKTRCHQAQEDFF